MPGRSPNLPRKLGRWATLRQVQALWEIRRGAAPALRTLRNWCATDALPAAKQLGGDWRVDMHALKNSASEGGRVLYEDLMMAMNSLATSHRAAMDE